MADLVFRGRIVETDSSDHDGQTRAVIAVNAGWKGVGAGSTVELVNVYGSCNVYWADGIEYLVYAHGRNGDWTTSACERTTWVAIADEDLAFLETRQPLPATATTATAASTTVTQASAPTAPAEQPPATDNPPESDDTTGPGGGLLATAIGVGALSAVILGGVIVYRRRAA